MTVELKVITLADQQYYHNLIKSLFATKTEMNDKVDKVAGKGLSTNDYTNAEKTKLDGVAAGAQVNVIETVKVNGTALPIANKGVNVDLTGYATNVAVADKVDKVDGKGLSTNDYTNADKSKLSGVAAGAQANVLEGVKVNGTALPITDKKVNIDLSSYATNSDLDGKVDKVAGKGLSTNDLTDALLTKLQNAGDSSFSGNYSDLVGKPDIGALAISAFEASTYKTDLTTIKSDYITSAGLAKAVAEAGHIKFAFVETLPASPSTNIIYFKKLANAQAEDAYEEYVWQNNKWEKIGFTRVDLSNYWSKTDFTLATTADIDAIVA